MLALGSFAAVDLPAILAVMVAVEYHRIVSYLTPLRTSPVSNELSNNRRIR